MPGQFSGYVEIGKIFTLAFPPAGQVIFEEYLRKRATPIIYGARPGIGSLIKDILLKSF
jgi:hypothetical protein